MNESSTQDKSPSTTTSGTSIKSAAINGSRGYWIRTRLFASLILVGLIFTNLVSEHRETSLIFSIFIAFFIWFVWLRGTTYGFIQRDGIRYKNYFRWKTARWEDIEDIAQPSMQIHPWSIIVTLRTENRFKRQLYFPRNPALFLELSAIEAPCKELTRAWLAGR